MRLFRSAILALLLAPGLATAATLGEARIGFSADRTLVFDGRVYQGKIWTMPGKERHEQAIQAFRPVFLLRADNPLGEVVLPQLHTTVQFAMPPELRLFNHPDLRKDPVGEASVNGIATTKYKLDQTVPEGHAAGTLGLSREGIPMRLPRRLAAPNGKVWASRRDCRHAP